MSTASMNENRKWKRRLAPHIYDYNYKVGESYYAPQTEYIDTRDLLRSRKQAPPEAQTFAERYAERPIYGKTRGLPYDSSESALNQPLMSRRSLSASRGRSRDRDEEEFSSSRLSRGRERERKVSFNPPEEIKRKFSLNDEFDFQDPVRRYTKSKQKIASEEDFDINPKTRKELEDEFKRIKNEFKKADSVERGSVPRTTAYEESIYNSDLGLPGKRRVKREDVSYTLPPSGAKVHKSSYSETSKFESSRPPRFPKPSRFSSIDNDVVDFNLPKTTRIRKFSVGDMDDKEFDLKYLVPRPSSRDRTLEEEKRFQQNLSLRERRRNEESELLSENISSLIDRMRSHNMEEDDGGFKFTRPIRASSVDPYEREPRVKARLQARAHKFTYGVSK